MGWTFTSRPKGKPIKEFLKERVFGPNFEIVECAVVKRTTAYVAARNLERPDRVFACVFLLAYRPHDYGYEFGYKDMDETMGPYYYDCPEHVLDVLTPTTNETALKWRAACRERLARKKVTPKVKPGDTIVFDAPIRFTNGKTLSRFRVLATGKTGRGRRFYELDENGRAIVGLYNIPGWRDKPHKVLKGGL